jgi:ribosomal protein S18 acetylase RimI-like enzyme
MTVDATIRAATADDTVAIQRVARESWHAAYDSILGPERVTDVVDSWFAPDRLLTDDIGPENRPFFVAVVDGSVVGFVEAVLADATPTAQLYRIYVAPDSWGVGIGTALLDRVEAVLRDRDMERLELSVFAANDGAVQFYESSGFERIGTAHDEKFDVERYEYAKEL